MRWMKWLLVFVFVIAAVWAAANYSKLPPRLSKDSESAKRLTSGFYEVASFPIKLKDNSRRTQANGEYEGDRIRVLRGKIWYPAIENAQIAPGKHPLVIFSHGFSSTHEGVDYMALHLSSRGYLVIAVDYPLTHMSAPGGPLVKDVVNQPADISFMIDTLLDWNEREQSAYYGRIDADRIGVFGISLGGMTTTMAAFHPRMADPRIAVAISLAGPTSMFTADFFSHRKLPFMMLAADQDAMVPYSDNAATIPGLVDDSWLLTIAGGSHTGFSGPAKYLRWLSNPDSIGCYVVRQQMGDDALEGDWWHLLGTAEDGVIQNAEEPNCPDPLPVAMNVLRQHQLTVLAVDAFFEMYFAETEGERTAARTFLAATLATENSEVTVQRGDPGG
ncbi:MAG: alpha/beta fold hydrolase [Pseudomonadales bacterium]